MATREEYELAAMVATLRLIQRGTYATDEREDLGIEIWSRKQRYDQEWASLWVFQRIDSLQEALQDLDPNVVRRLRDLLNRAVPEIADAKPNPSSTHGRHPVTVGSKWRHFSYPSVYTCIEVRKDEVVMQPDNGGRRLFPSTWENRGLNQGFWAPVDPEPSSVWEILSKGDDPLV